MSPAGVACTDTAVLASPEAKTGRSASDAYAAAGDGSRRLSTQPTLSDSTPPKTSGRTRAERRRIDYAAVAAMVTSSRAEQGLPPTVTDPEVLLRVAAVFLRGDGITSGATSSYDPPRLAS